MRKRRSEQAQARRALSRRRGHARRLVATSSTAVPMMRRGSSRVPPLQPLLLAHRPHSPSPAQWRHGACTATLLSNQWSWQGPPGLVVNLRGAPDAARVNPGNAQPATQADEAKEEHEYHQAILESLNIQHSFVHPPPVSAATSQVLQPIYLGLGLDPADVGLWLCPLLS